jgi:hypothetical protein
MRGLTSRCETWERGSEWLPLTYLADIPSTWAHIVTLVIDAGGHGVTPVVMGTPMADLERILQQLHDSEINAGVQTFYDAGMRVWIGDEANGIQAETTINRTAAARLKWPKGRDRKGLAHHLRRPALGEPHRGRSAPVEVAAAPCE